jgi:hypothetical protein
MSTIACSIVDLGDNPDASKWYLETHVPRVVAKLGGTAYSASKTEENVFPGIPSIEGQYITRYELPEGADAKAAESYISVTSEKLPLSAKIETRMYERQETWYGGGWRGRKLMLSGLLYPLIDMARHSRYPILPNGLLAGI